MSNERERRQARLLAALQSAGCRLTEPRRAVVAVLADGSPHLSHAEVLAQARQRCPDIGRATVYRTLELLEQLGLIHATYLGDATQRFVLPVGGHHHHLVCGHCGGVEELDDCHFGAALAAVSQQTGFAIASHLVELHGTCVRCQARSA